jgi:hypothetical protein
MATLDNALHHLAAPAIYSHLIHFCLDLRADTAGDIERGWSITPDEAHRLGLRSAPTWIGNLIASQACFEKFGAEILARVPGFFSFTRENSVCLCFEWNHECVCHLETWRLDLDSHLARRGVVVPLKERGMIVGLKIFRSIKDSRPFSLVTRGANERGAA